MHVINPTGRNLKYELGFRNWNGRKAKVAGDRDLATTRRIGDRVEQLVRAKLNGDQPPGELATWINNMHETLAKKLIALGLIPPRHRARNIPLIDWVEPWCQVVRGRNPDSTRHAEQQRGKLKRLIEATQAVRLEDFEADVIIQAINGFVTLGHNEPTPLSTSTRRSYGIAAKDFAAWLAAKLKCDDPLVALKLPGQYSNPEYERQPLTVAQFQTLMKYMGTFERYKMQKARWTAADRKLIYWTAVQTGYREGELAKLRKWNLYLDESPPVIGLKARHNKNKAKGEVPIPSDLAKALKAYIAELEPDDRVFPFPATCGSIVDMLRRDLDGAGIPWHLPGGEIVDFHTFRSTAITWWLDVRGLRPKRVQILARLKSITMLNNYSRNMRIDEFDWLDDGPDLLATGS